MITLELILLLIGGLIAVLALLIVAGMVLSARSYTQLQESTRFLGSWVLQILRANQQAQTPSSGATDSDTTSALITDTPTMPELPDASSVGNGDMATK